MNVFNISRLKLNDSHSYYGGAIGNIAYNLMDNLARREGVTLESSVQGAELESAPPDSLTLFNTDSDDEINSRLRRQTGNIDVVTHLYFHEPEYNPLSKTAGNLDAPFVIGMCEVPHPRFSDEVSGIKSLPLVRKIGKKFIMPRFKRTLRRCDRLIVVNEDARNYYSKYIDRSKIEIIPYGVDLERFLPSEQPDTPVILMVNRLVKRRGIDHMIAALPQIALRVPDVKLYIVGDGPQKQNLLSQAESLGIRDRVTFFGNVSANELVSLYAGCSLFSHLSYADGWNQPALEAMASAKPIACTDRPHNSMVADGENGLKVPWNDVDAVATAVANILSDESLAERFGKRGRKKAESKYNWTDIAAQYHNIYDEVA